MPPLVIARYRDGRLLKGTTLNFRPEAGHCHIVPSERPYGEGTRVEYADLKAIFFVRDLAGNPFHKDRMEFTRPAGYGYRVRVRFHDGEEMLGVVYHVDRSQPGFFLYPADAESNNERVFAVLDAVAALDFVDVEPESPTEEFKSLTQAASPAPPPPAPEPAAAPEAPPTA